MTPDLSRRVGRALHAADATFAEHVAAVNVLARVRTVEALPSWLGRLVERGERRLRGRP